MFSRHRMRTAPTVGWLLGNSFVALPVDILPDWCSQVACPEEDYEVELEFKQGYGMDYCESERGRCHRTTQSILADCM